MRTRRRPAGALRQQLVDKAIGYGVPGVRADGNDIFAVYRVTKDAVDHARTGGGVTLSELPRATYRRKGHAEHDSQSYVPPGEIDDWAAHNDPIDRYMTRLTGEFGFDHAELAAIDDEVRATVDVLQPMRRRPPCDGPDALRGVRRSRRDAGALPAAK